VNGDGSFVVVWQSDLEDDGEYTAIVGRRYDGAFFADGFNWNLGGP
jgi:hypothetical protein